MIDIKAIFYQDSLKEFSKFCDENNIEIQEWQMETGLGWSIEYRVDVYDLDNKQKELLKDYIGSNEFLDYDYVIIWN